MQCLVCHERRPKHLLRETKNKSRVFCGNLCQENFYLGLKYNDIDDPDMIGLESSDGIKFKIRVKDAMEFKTLAALIEDLGGNDFIPLPNIDSGTVRLLFTMVRDFYNVRTMLNAKTADEILKLVFALVYLDNSALLFEFLQREKNFMQMLLDNSNGPWLALLKDILPLVFVSNGDLTKTKLIELFKKLGKEQVLMRNACMHFWKIENIDKKDLLLFFAKHQGDLSVVKYLVEEENVYSNQLLVIAVKQENRPLFSYVLSNKKFLTSSALADAIRDADSVTFLDDLLRAVGESGDEKYPLIQNANRQKFERGEDPSLFFYLIKKLIATNTILIDSGTSCVRNAFHIACQNGWIDIVKFILSLKQPIFSNNIITISLLVRDQECIIILLHDERFLFPESLFWNTILKSEVMMKLVLDSPPLNELATRIIKLAIERDMLFRDDLETWQALYRFYPQIMQRFKASDVSKVENLDVAVFFSENVK